MSKRQFFWSITALFTTVVIGVASYFALNDQPLNAAVASTQEVSQTSIQPSNLTSNAVTTPTQQVNTLLATDQTSPILTTDELVAENTATAEQQTRASLLEAEVNDVTPDRGPILGMMDQVRGIMCPIMGQIPVLNDAVGTIAMTVGIACPTNL